MHPIIDDLNEAQQLSLYYGLAVALKRVLATGSVSVFDLIEHDRVLTISRAKQVIEYLNHNKNTERSLSAHVIENAIVSALNKPFVFVDAQEVDDCDQVTGRVARFKVDLEDGMIYTASSSGKLFANYIIKIPNEGVDITLYPEHIDNIGLCGSSLLRMLIEEGLSENSIDALILGYNRENTPEKTSETTPGF